MRADWFGSEPNPGKDRDDQCTAILAFMVGVKPDDPIEGMIAAQLFASHAAAMECYRRAMLPNQTAYGRESNLAMAAKLTRANASQVEALTKHRGKGQQKVTVEHVHVYQGGQAIVGNVPPGGSAIIMRYNPMLLHMRQAPRCGAKTRRQTLCQSPAMPNGRCRMHGGPSPEGGLGRRARQAVQANVRASWRRTPSGRLELSRSRVSRVFGLGVESDRRVWGGLMDDVHHGLE
jgi:hypothetical protein